MLKHPTFLKVCCMAILSCGLAACGGGGGTEISQSSAGIQSRDSFFATVFAMVATDSDTAEPQETDAITATSPQDAEPSAVGG